MLILLASIPTNADPDLWGNLRFGLDILATRQITTDDPYSFTQDIPWVNHEWLAQVVMAAVYSLGGSTALILLKSGMVLTTLWLVRGALAGARGLLPEAGALLVLWAALPITLTFRAQLWSFLFLALLCRMLLASPQRVRWAPLLMVIWVNSHMGWVIGLAVLAWWGIGVVVRERGRARTEAVVIVALSALATLINPYGLHLWDFATGVTHLSRRLQEWQPLWTSPVINWIPSLIAATLAIAALLRPPRLPFERAAALAGLAYVASQVHKFTPLFVELTVLFLAPLARAHFPAGAPAPTATLTFRRANAVALGVIAVMVAVTSWPRLQCLPSSADWRPDATVARALLDTNPVGRMAVWFNWGEYAIWHFGPRLKVSFDPRYDLVYSPETIDEQENVARGTPKGTAFLARTRPEYIWYPQSKTELRAWVPDNGYRIDVETGESFLAVRSDLQVVRQPAVQTFGCFPAP